MADFTQIDALLALPPGWDSYDARPIDPRAVEAAKLFMARAQATPICTGGVQIEWHTHGFTLEIMFGPDGVVTEQYMCRRDGRPMV